MGRKAPRVDTRTYVILVALCEFDPEVKFMGLYDVKNGKLLERRDDESALLREPQTDINRFTSFVNVANRLMQRGRDVV